MLEQKIKEKCKHRSWEKPLLLELSLQEDKDILDKLFAENKVYKVVDCLEQIQEELATYQTKTKENVEKPSKDSLTFGTWVYFPWNEHLVRYPKKEDYRALKTFRYRNLITKEEQEQLNTKRICVFGMSVGSNVALTLVRNAVCNAIAIGDFDMPSVTNMGRIELLLEDLPYSKVDGVAKKISQIDPFMEQLHFEKGFHTEIQDELLAFKPDIVINEIDNMVASFQIRSFCKENRIPYMTVSDLHDNLGLEIIRFDKDENAPLAVARLPKKYLEKVLSGTASADEQGLVEGLIVGFTNWTSRLTVSALDAENQLDGVPQLGSTTTACSGFICTAVRNLFLGENIRTGLYCIKLAKKLGVKTRLKDWIEMYKSYKEYEKKANEGNGITYA